MGFDKEKIRELYPGAEDLMIEPMLYHKSEKDQLKKACNSGDYFGQIKKDGAFYSFVKTEDNCYLFGRTVSKTTNLLTEKAANVPHIIKALESLPNKTVLIGEIYYPDGTSKNVTSIMGCLPKKAISRQEDEGYGLIHYYIHDILWYDGYGLLDTPAFTRYNILKTIVKKHDLLNDYIELAEVWEDNLYERVAAALESGEEGMVIKKKNGLYLPGKRPLDNLKAKQVDFIDAFIIGFEKPTREYEGKELESWQYWYDPCFENPLPIKSYYEEYKKNPDIYQPVTKAYYMGWDNSRIIIGAYDNDRNVISIGTISSGITDEMKKDMSENPQKYLFKVVSIQAMSTDAIEKTIRHGFLKEIRDDKNADECLIRDIFK